MAMDVGGSKGGIKSDINVTPLVDVMLVLLIIVQQGVQLTLPSAGHAVPKPDTDDQVTVFVDAQGRLYFNAVQLSEPELIAQLRSTVEEGDSQTIYLKGDMNAPYSAIMQMMDALRAAQIETVALITEAQTEEEGGQ
jgi:biopolymer transport protein ExbD